MGTLRIIPLFMPSDKLLKYALPFLVKPSGMEAKSFRAPPLLGSCDRNHLHPKRDVSIIKEPDCAFARRESGCGQLICRLLKDREDSVPTKGRS